MSGGRISTRWLWSLAALALAAAAPAAAQSGDRVTREMRRFGDTTPHFGRIGGGPVEKIIGFGYRNGRSGAIDLTDLLFVPAGEWPTLPVGGIALMRTRAVGGDGNLTPPDADFDYVRRTGQRLFVVGEWALPPPIWEIVREDDGGLRFREIGVRGRPGRWRARLPAGTS